MEFTYEPELTQPGPATSSTTTDGWKGYELINEHVRHDLGFISDRMFVPFSGAVLAYAVLTRDEFNSGELADIILR
ncbi:uncharacterized protein N7477_003818 [Penicillium maclennaniae]|uniref:uncharacterized protein n=1 Tax=Penicillium maclennaniae TaxID=1343394 RepID=UPI0025412860|nr:uncharacterized protein N7477_003818 [Penicillium maclennaniae]KAJ5678185.1 hypothetical protein N7477_003818 [Penicillium maclennaniae]